MTQKQYRELEKEAIKKAKELRKVLDKIFRVDTDWCDHVIERVKDEASL